jgi:putative transposase
MKTIANVLGVARSHLHERVHRPTAARGSYCKAADEELLPLIRRLVDERPTYDYRRVTALVNRVLAAEGQPAANHKVRSNGGNTSCQRISSPTPQYRS